jgi:hypothetical protein
MGIYYGSASIHSKSVSKSSFIRPRGGAVRSGTERVRPFLFIISEPGTFFNGEL